MTMQTKLASRASTLSRTIYASLPFEHRVAHLLVRLRLAGMWESSYGRLMYAEFIKVGVPDLPDILVPRNIGPWKKGEVIPALDMQKFLLSKGDRASSFLPEHYGSRLGNQMWALATRYLKDRELVEELMQQVSVELTAGSKQVIKRVSLSKAESYVKDRVKKRSLDIIRSQKRRGDPLVDTDISERVDIAAPAAVSRFLDKLRSGDESELREILRDEVDSRHPNRAWEWIEAQLEGMSGRDLAEQWGVSPSAVTQWIQRNLPAIRKVFEDFGQGPDQAVGY